MQENYTMKKIAILFMIFVIAGILQAVVTDNFESGTFNAWNYNTCATIKTDPADGNKYARVELAETSGDLGVLGGFLGDDTNDGASEFLVSFKFRFKDTGQRQMNMHIGRSDSAYNNNVTAVNLAYDGTGTENRFEAYSGTAWVTLTSLPTNLADNAWHTVTIEGRYFGTTNAEYDVTVNGIKQAGIKTFHNTAKATTYLMNGFNFNDRFGSNPGFDVDDVTATLLTYKAKLVSPVYAATGIAQDALLEWAAPKAYVPQYYSVYLGTTEPNALLPNYGLTRVVDKQNITFFDPSLGYMTTYYWVVDTYEPNSPNPTLHQGDFWNFTTIADDPSITSHPNGKTVAAGDMATFAVAAKNDEGGYQWFKEGIADPLPNDGVNYIIDANSLTVLDVQHADEGFYYCKVFNASAVSAQSNAAQLITKRLAGKWSFENNLTDDIEGYVGSIAEPNYTTGLVGQGYHFFSDARFITIPGSNLFYNFYSRGLTANVWVKTPVTADPYNAAICKRTNIGGMNGWVLWAQGDSINHSAGQLQTIALNGSSSNDNTWHMLTLTYNPDTKVTAFYFDGELQATSTLITPSAIGPDQPLVFGTSLGEGSSAGKMTGVIDEVEIYTYDLEITGVLDLYNTYVEPDKVLCILDYAAAVDKANTETGLDADDAGFVPDCRINMDDFAYFAKQWMQCGVYPQSACN